METTTIRVETERMTPSKVRNERSLCVRSVSSAISAGSRNDTPLLEIMAADIDSKSYAFCDCITVSKDTIFLVNWFPGKQLANRLLVTQRFHRIHACGLHCRINPEEEAYAAGHGHGQDNGPKGHGRG